MRRPNPKMICNPDLLEGLRHRRHGDIVTDRKGKIEFIVEKRQLSPYDDNQRRLVLPCPRRAFLAPFDFALRPRRVPSSPSLERP